MLCPLLTSSSTRREEGEKKTKRAARACCAFRLSLSLSLLSPLNVSAAVAAPRRYVTSGGSGRKGMDGAGGRLTGRRDGDDTGDGGALWIVKPSDSSRGRGVYLLRELGELAYGQMSVVQRYISNPLTVGGYKADLRL